MEECFDEVSSMKYYIFFIQFAQDETRYFVMELCEENLDSFINSLKELNSPPREDVCITYSLV
jgi:hypothetical protein